MKAFVLAGGLGTRLRHVLPDLPKPMAPVGGRPFLEYLILQLRRSRIREIVLSVGHLAEKIQEHFGDGGQLGVSISYAKEELPLGTGGALLKACPVLAGDDFLVMNGDSFLDLDLEHLIQVHQSHAALVTMALTRVQDNARYGSVQLDDDGKITGFFEKGEMAGPGYINSGIYSISSVIFEHLPHSELPFSLERDVFPQLVGKGFYGLEVNGFFRDIGIPVDYQAMCDDPSPLLGGARHGE